jgi:thiamine-phosphate pyrophosphorylase
VDVAIACRADGVHLRSDDISPRDVRNVWEARREMQLFVAVSCHTAGEVARAASEGADLAVFAPVFEKKEIGGALPAGLAALHDACQQNIPVLALGGINLKNAQSCPEAGAAGIAGIRIFQEGDIAAVVRALRG